MSNYKLKNDEIIIFEGQVGFENIETDVKFTLTNQKIILEKEKGLFKKKLRVVDIIPLENIKIYKDEVQIKQNKSVVTIQTIDKTIIFTCANIFEAKKIVEEIITVKTGSSKLERHKNKLKKFSRILGEFKDIVLTVSGIVLAIKGYFNNKDK